MSSIAVAVSGGVDSLFALHSLHKQGHKVLAVHGLFLSNENTQTIHELEDHCQRLHIPLHIVDLRKQFDSLVITPFIEFYAQGQTPNPCALCNAFIKFGLLMDAALELGADFFATGHYATSNGHGLSPLSKGQDSSKEQSYFLALTPKQRFDKIIFPLANTNKKDNLLYLQHNGFDILDKGESQEICFVPENAYRPFLIQQAKFRSINLPQSGPFLIKDGLNFKQVGVHNGLWQYTEGQRKGLGIAWKEPLYVCKKDSEQNSIVLATAKDLSLHGCLVSHLNLFVERKHWPNELYARVRYRQKDAKISISWHGEDLQINFNEPQNLTACGQLAVIYDNDGHVIAGGIISKLF